MRYRPEYDPCVIGNNLKRLRIAHGFTVEDVREYLQLGSVQAIYKYESGRGYPQADTLLALMELYDADLCDLVIDHEKLHHLERRQTERLLMMYGDLCLRLKHS